MTDQSSTSLPTRYAPWRGGHGGVRVGLVPIEARDWLVDPAQFHPHDIGRAARCATKRGQFAAQPAAVYGVTGAQTNAAILELHAHLRDHVGAIRGWSAHADVPPLIDAAYNVAEDLCVLLPTPPAGVEQPLNTDPDYALVAAALFAPSFWRLAEKLGKPLAGVHAPVANLEARIGPRIRAFLHQLPAGRVFMRGNWNLHVANALFHPQPDDWSQAQTLTATNIGSRLWMRCERQTLLKLPQTGAIVFTILVLTERLDALTDDPPLLTDLWRAYQGMPAIEQTDRHFPLFAAPLHDWLGTLQALPAES